MAQVKVKTITYKPNGNKPEDNSGFDPFYGSEGENLIEFPRDRIKPWWTNDDETRRKAIKKHYASGPSLEESNATWWDLQYDTYKSLGGRLPFDLFKKMMLEKGDIGDLDYGAKRKPREGIRTLLTKAEINNPSSFLLCKELIVPPKIW